MLRCLLLILSFCLALPSMTAATNLHDSNEKSVGAVLNDSTMFIHQGVDSLTEAERYFNPIYLIVQQGKEHLKQQLVRGSICDCDTTIANRRIGVFSVAPGKFVSFSQGNLQFFPAADAWKFADMQHEYLGNTNKYNAPTYRNWVDLFDWPTDSLGNFSDWGTNTICGDAPGTWRTLTTEEWKYLLHDRSNASGLLSYAQVAGIKGLVILPDDWQIPDNLSFISAKDKEWTWGGKFPSSYSHPDDHINTYDIQQWQLMEAAGAVFMPCAGFIQTATLQNLGTTGRYWSATKNIKTKAFYMSFGSTNVHSQSDFNKGEGYSTRLVHDTILPMPPTKSITVNDVTFNMVFVQGGTFMMGAASDDKQAEVDEKPAHQVTLSDYYIAQTEVTQALWEAVMQDNPSANKASGNHPVENILWNDCRLFVQKLNELTGLTFRLPTEAEWEYAARGGKRSCGYKYAGSNDINEVAWYEDNCTASQPVAQKKPNELGLYDMSGNVYEFCYDWYAPYTAVAQTNPIGPSSSPKNMRTVRGGGWARQNTGNGVRYCRTTNRGYHNNTRSIYSGLRLVLQEADIVTLTVNSTPSTAKVGFYARRFEYKRTSNSITADKGSEVMYQVTDVDAGYLSQGKSFSRLQNDTTLNINLLPFSEGKWGTIDNSAFSKTEDYYIGRSGEFASTTAWDYYVLPVVEGETYRVRAIAGQGAPLWFLATSAPDLATETRPNKVVCSDNDGICAYIAEEFTVPAGASYLIVNARQDKKMIVEKKLPDSVLVVTINDTLSFNMIFVQGGTFMMGAADNDLEAQANEKPAHLVTLSDFYMAQTELTQELWRTLMGTTLTQHWEAHNRPQTPLAGEGDLYPMYKINIADCQQFIDTLNKLTGLRFRLPTEAEWEYAARGGIYNHGYKYPGGNDLDSLAWYDQNSNDETHPVALKQPNELGIYDMAGNVWEWVSDWYATYSPEPQINPVGPTSGTHNIIRGGSRSTTFGASNCRVSARRAQDLSNARTFIGLRLLLDSVQ